MLIFVLIFLGLGLTLAVFGFLMYRKILRRAKGIERGLKMVPILIHLPPRGEAQDTGTRDAREVMREKVSQANVLYDLISGTAQAGFKSSFYGQRHVALEMIASGGRIYYYAAVPVALVPVVQQAILTAYPGARLEETEDHNVFSKVGKLAGTAGGELVLKKPAAYPIAAIEQIERDPMEAVINALSGLQPDEGAAVQILLRPARRSWIKDSVKLVKLKKARAENGLKFTPMDLAKATLKAPKTAQEQNAKPLSGLEQSAVDAIEEKTRHSAYEVLIRVVVSAETNSRAQTVMRAIVATFALFDAPGLNGFKFLPAANLEGLVTAFIFRFFPPELDSDILNSHELAGIFHLPDSQTPVSDVARQASKQVDAPALLPSSGLLLGYNAFRGEQKEVRLTPDDRRRHTYIVGQTGTGKSVLLENLAVQDMLEGNGFAFIDPHGDTVERLIGMVPKHRAEDIVYFNPGDTDYPLGLNLFEYTAAEQKDFLIQEAINMLYKIYDPGKTGIIGPRFEQWFRNAALTLMSDPEGSTFIEVPNIFTDTEFLKRKFKYLQDPTVIDFWTKEMAQTSDYHKSEMLGWFNSKFGAFQQNEIMRNIIGQTKSAFNLREIMDQRKILLVNLSKGKIGDLNSNLLGMIFVIKFQAAAMSRAAVPEDQRPDFCLYVDEFQNFSTDSFASILSEARKYRLNLIVANQFIGQLTEPIKNAVFGNVGSIVSFRCGPEDADFLVKQFAPSFDTHDLVNLQVGNAVVRLLVGGLPTQPFSMATLPPLEGVSSLELGLAVKQLSAAKFGRRRAAVEAEIFGRMKGAPTLAGMVQTSGTVGSGQQSAGAMPNPAAVPSGSNVPQPPPTSPASTPAPLPEQEQMTGPSTASPLSVPNSPPSSPSGAPASSAKPIQGSLSIADIVKDMPSAPVKSDLSQPLPVTDASLAATTGASEAQKDGSASHDSAAGVRNELAGEVKSEGLEQLIRIPPPLAPDVSGSVLAPTPANSSESTVSGPKEATGSQGQVSGIANATHSSKSHSGASERAKSEKTPAKEQDKVTVVKGHEERRGAHERPHGPHPAARLHMASHPSKTHARPAEHGNPTQGGLSASKVSEPPAKEVPAASKDLAGSSEQADKVINVNKSHATQQEAPVQPKIVAAPGKPKIAPGEIYVDEQGQVHFG
jgi:hypothetical protein